MTSELKLFELKNTNYCKINTLIYTHSSDESLKYFVGLNCTRNIKVFILCIFRDRVALSNDFTISNFPMIGKRHDLGT